MPRFLRSAGSVVAGLVAGIVVVAAIEGVGSALYPLPPGVDPTDRAALATHVAGLPLGAFAIVLAGWGAGTLLGAWLATRLSPGRAPVHGWVVGALLLGAGAFNLVVIPHPAWFAVVAVLVFVSCACAGGRLGRVA